MTQLPPKKYFGSFDWCEHLDLQVVDEDWLINGEFVETEDYHRFIRAIATDPVCPYCGEVMLDIVLPSGLPPGTGRTMVDLLSRRWFMERSLRLCTKCGFWKTFSDEFRGIYNGSIRTYAAAVQNMFPIDIPGPPMAELIEYTRRHPHKVGNLHPKGFEKIVAECFRANWNPVEVIHVGGPNDDGIDLSLVKSDSIRWLIQYKCRESAAGVEGVSTVRELLGTLLSEGDLRGIVVSSNDHFSYHARRLAKKPNLIESGYEVELFDYGILKELLIGTGLAPEIKVRPTKNSAEISLNGPWQSFFSRHDN